MIGQRIKQARKAAGLSMRDLAQRAKISAMSISKYENGQATPSSGVLIALARALHVRTEYFFRTNAIELEGVEYRKHRKLGAKTLDQIHAGVIEQLERFFELLDFLPTHPIAQFEPPANLAPHIDSLDQIEEVAIAVREAWGLGNNPIPDLTDALEERGVMVFQTEVLHGDKFDGLAATVNGLPIIVVGAHWPGDRQRFTLAHELGHLILSERLTDNLDEEKACNRFAGAFLAPAPEVSKELGTKRTWLEPRELNILKKAYGLSMSGWIHRAEDLNILSKANAGKMRIFFRKQGWIKNEPGGIYPSEQPSLFTQLVYHALAEGLIAESKAAELLMLPLPEFHRQRNMERAQQAAD
ncbi:MAG TPA: helix-turn-helix domain-containing protein [Gammaproteobacteria bacterium]|nr:helix-turn-helix domain-containing protein [Gammaproteobacteria bacterium]